jgi:hypothetical protein
MKQTTIPALDVQVALELLRVDLLHIESNTWILKSTLRHGRDAVSELLRLARLYRRLESYLHTQPEGQYEGYGAVRLKYRDIVLVESNRTIYPERKSPLKAPAPKAPKAATPKARAPAVSPVNSATLAATCESKQPKGRAGAATDTLRKAVAKPKRIE